MKIKVEIELEVPDWTERIIRNGDYATADFLCCGNNNEMDGINCPDEIIWKKDTKLDLPTIRPGDGIAGVGTVESNHCGLPWPVDNDGQTYFGCVTVGTNLYDAKDGHLLTAQEILDRIDNWKYNYDNLLKKTDRNTIPKTLICGIGVRCGDYVEVQKFDGHNPVKGIIDQITFNPTVAHLDTGAWFSDADVIIGHNPEKLSPPPSKDIINEREIFEDNPS